MISEDKKLYDVVYMTFCFGIRKMYIVGIQKTRRGIKYSVSSSTYADEESGEGDFVYSHPQFFYESIADAMESIRLE